MSERGLCSRREADRYIELGWVFVDGRRITTLGTRVAPDAAVTLDERARSAQRRSITVLLNKPVGYVSGQPEKGYPPAASLVTPDNRHHGGTGDSIRVPRRLPGLADGRVARTLVGADSEVEKEYLVRVDGDVSEPVLRRLRYGLSLDGRALKRAGVERLNADQLRFVLTEGRKRQIRRMCELVGLRVTGLKRVRIGAVKLGRLPTGKWRLLGEDERF